MQMDIGLSQWCPVPGRGSGPKLEHRKFLLNFRKQPFPVKVSDYLDRLPSEVVIFILGDIQINSERDPRQLSVEQKGWITWPPEVYSNLNHSEILWMLDWSLDYEGYSAIQQVAGKKAWSLLVMSELVLSRNYHKIRIYNDYLITKHWGVISI